MVNPPESPGGNPMGWKGITVLTVYYLLVAALVVHGLVVLWPPRPGGGEDGEDETAAQVAALAERLEEIQKASANGAAGPATAAAQPASPVPGGAEGSVAVAAIRSGSEPGGAAAPAVLREPPPPTAGPDRCAEEGQERAEFLRWSPCLSSEERLFLIVLFAGALGGLVHSLRSFYWYLGNRELVLSWLGMYVTLPVVGAAMALVFYLVIRGGFTPQEAGSSQTNPFGFAALAVLVGMFTEQAAQRLKEVAENVFAKAQTGKDHAGPPTVTKVDPQEGPQAGGTPIEITGTGFKEGVVVQFGGKPATEVKVVDDTRIQAKTPAAAAGAATVEVINPGGQKGSLPDGFRYT